MVISDLPPVSTDGLDVETLDVETEEAADRLGYQLVRFMRLVSRIGSHVAARQADGMESAAYALLAHLVKGGPRRTTALAEAMHSDTSTVSRQSAALVRDGLVERRADPADGRAFLLAATERGAQMFEHNRRRRNAHLAAMLHGWPSQELHEFTGLLARFNTSFEDYRQHLLGTESAQGQNEGETVR